MISLKLYAIQACIQLSLFTDYNKQSNVLPKVPEYELNRKTQMINIVMPCIQRE